ncbi:WD40-repeat-containing domain protein [Phycomyces nitens]|nr:WD40-repeat-containing domain protein [Phycomyces nitens]
MSERIQQYIRRRQCYGDRYSPYGGIPKALFAQNIYADRYTLSRMTLDRELQGHTGCVNTLFWSSRGDKLVSGSDDTKAIIWLPQENYRKACTIDTGTLFWTAISMADLDGSAGHRANIFSAKFMPATSDSILVTAAADSEVRVFDINSGNQGESKSTLRHVYWCHSNSVKSIETEDGNPHEFFTCAEDGTVRHFDIRQPHKCTPHTIYNSFGSPRVPRQPYHTATDIPEGCPAPLLDYGKHLFRLNSLSINKLHSRYFAVAGMDAYIYLHDRRMVGHGGGGAGKRQSIDAATRCIRRFKPRPSQNHSINLYVTSCKFSDYNGEELLGSWSSGEIGLFDIHDTTPGELPNLGWHQSTQKKLSGSPQDYNTRAPRLATPDDIHHYILSGNYERALERLEDYMNPFKRPNDNPEEEDIERIWCLCLSAALRLHRLYEQTGWRLDLLESLSSEYELHKAEESIAEAEDIVSDPWRGMWCLAIGFFLASGGPCQTNFRHRRAWLIKSRYYGYLAYRTFQENEAVNSPLHDEGSSQVSIDYRMIMIKEFLDTIEKAIEQEDTRTDFEPNDEPLEEREVDMASVQTSLRWKWVDKMYFPNIDTNDGDTSQDEDITEDDNSMVRSNFNSSDEELLEHLAFAATHDSNIDSAENSVREGSGSEREDDAITFNDIIALNNSNEYERDVYSSSIIEVYDAEEDEDDDDEEEEDEDGTYPVRRHIAEVLGNLSRRSRSYLENNTPILVSEKIYKGHCNIMTTKGVNFYGPKDEYVVSGSDDGLLFVWDKKTTEIVQILQGDQDTVNVIQGHPFLPHMAVSGIDNTIKIFTPTSGPFTTSPKKEPRLKTSYSPSSRMFEKDAIVERNIETHLSEPLIGEDTLYMDAETFLHEDPSLAVLLAEVSRS